jgi:hypothetical protein
VAIAGVLKGRFATRNSIRRLLRRGCLAPRTLLGTRAAMDQARYWWRSAKVKNAGCEEEGGRRR